MANFTDILLLLQVVLGIGLVIFVHEAGHFIAARMCGVRVDVFSLGFGPRLLGFRRGATLYQVAAIPLGGYVRMAGEEASGDMGSHDPGAQLAAVHSDLRQYGDELHEKSVGQRFFIYSGGVIMNVIFALIVFPLVLLAGVPVVTPQVDAPVPGSPAWHARVVPGSRVLAVNGNDVFDFLHIPNEVALGGSRPAEFTLVRPGETKPETVVIHPKYHSGTGIYRVGLEPAYDPQSRVAVIPESAAARAGLQDDDRLIAIQSEFEGLPLRHQVNLAQREQGAIELTVARGGEVRQIKIEPELQPAGASRKLIGVEPTSDFVRDVRRGPLVDDLGIQAGDRLLRVNGVPIERGGDVLIALLAPHDELTMQVLRDGLLRDLKGPAVDTEAALALNDDLFVTIDRSHTSITVMPGSAAAEAGLVTGDRIVAIDGSSVDTWDEFQELAGQAARSDAAVRVAVVRGSISDAPQSLEFNVTPRAIELPSYGFGITRAENIHQADNVIAAIEEGCSSSWRFLVDAWLTVRRIASGEVSSDNVGGIITIGKVSHSWATQGLSKLFFFLCMLSMNLAFINVLPIPVLDGGHLFFCIVEKIKGSPVSERTLGYSQIVGLVLIVSLMVYVTYNDVVRWFVD